MNQPNTAGYMQVVPQPYNYCPYCGHSLTGYTTRYTATIGGAAAGCAQGPIYNDPNVKK